MGQSLRSMVFWLLLAVLAGSLQGDEKKLQESFWQLYTSALRGDMKAQYEVGTMYEQGKGVGRDLAQAALWYEKAAWQGHVDAQYNLALMYTSGRGVDPNEERAMLWLAKAARQGDKEARRLLLAIVDGKIDLPPKKISAPLLPAQQKGPIVPMPASPVQQTAAPAASAAVSDSQEAVAIMPVTLITKEGAQVCTLSGTCSVYKAKTTLTSKSKRGKFYKISGIGTKQGWKPFEEEGWIDEESVEIRR